MDEQAVTIVVHQPQRAQPVDMLARQVLHVDGIIAAQRRVATFQEPAADGEAVIKRRERERLMVSHQRCEGAGSAGLQRDQELDDTAAVRAAVDVVAEKDESQRSPGRVALAVRDEVFQLGERTVDIADRIGQHVGCCSSSRTRKNAGWVERRETHHTRPPA